MKLLIDTNVILDMVFQRNGCDNSMKLFRKIRDNGDSAYITASSVTDLFYIICKEIHDTGQTYIIMENIFKLVSVRQIGKLIVCQSDCFHCIISQTYKITLFRIVFVGKLIIH